MKYLNIYILVSFLFCAKSFGQNHLKLKERNLIPVNSNDYKIKVIPLKKTIDKDEVLYNSKGSIISYKKIKKHDFMKAKIMNFDSLGMKNSFKADLKLENNKLYIYPWIYTGDCKEVNQKNTFFNKHLIYIDLEDRKNYSFRYKSFQIGVFTVPVKMYLKGNLGNVNLSANAMFNLGYNFGKNRFVKLPNEENARNYKSNYSVNFLLGITSIALDDSNVKQERAIKGKVGAVSSGLSFGVHYNDFSFMLAAGFDLPTSNRKDWKFSGIPWLGFGVGIDFLKFK